MTSLPTWITTLSDSVIQKDAIALYQAGTQTFAGDVSLMNDLVAELAATNSTLSAAQLSDLQAVALNISSLAPYLASGAFSHVVFYSSTGDYLTVGDTSSQVARIADEWLQGTPPGLRAADVAAGATYAAQALPLYGVSGLPTPTDVRQGAVGDSNFLAAAIDLANTDPTALTAKFVDLGNGTLAVELNNQWCLVTNQLPVSASGALIYSASAENWSNLLEKAAAQLNISGTGGTGFFGDNTGANYGNLDGVSATQSFAALTGSSAFQIATYASSDPHWTSYKLLFETALSAKDSLILSELGTSKDSSGNVLFAGSQSYAVIGYDAQSGDFILRNPKGDQGTNQGYVAQFEASMADIAAVQGSMIVNNDITSVTVATALALQAGTAPVVVQDSAATVFAHLDALQAMVQAGSLSSIGLTDSSAASATLTQAQFINDSGILANITGNYSLAITNVGAAVAAALIMQPNVTQVSVSDTAAAIGANLDALQNLVGLSECNLIAVTDGATASIPVSVTQLTADQAALNAIQGSYALAVSGVGVTAAAATLALSHVATINISDSAATIIANLDQLQSLSQKGQMTGITLTDSGIPALSVTAAQLTSDRAALDDITGSFTVSVAAGSSAVNLTGIAGHATTIDFSGNASQYSIATANGMVTVSSGGVTDTLSNIAAIKFADFSEIVAAAPGSGGVVTTGNVTELYAAVLNREPDLPGLVFYQTYLQKNPSTPLQQFATYFLSSPEYNSAHSYAETTAGDTQFITDSYQNLLHRTPTAVEVAFYETNVLAPAVAGLTAGTAAYANAQLQSHALLLTYFSGSPEFLSDVQVTATNPPSAQHWLILT